MIVSISWIKSLMKHNICKKNISIVIIYRLDEIDLKCKKYYYMNMHPLSATKLPKMKIYLKRLTKILYG